MKRITSLLLLIAILLIPFISSGQDVVKYPAKPITFILNVAPGGGGDITIRALCKIAEGLLGQPIVIENKPGAGGAIGMNLLAKAKNDGYTIGRITYSSTVIMPHTKSVPYNTKEDFNFICQVAQYTHAFVVKANAPWKTFNDFIEDARKNPGKRTYCTTGTKGGQHIFIEEIALMANMKLRHIPYASDAEEIAAVLGGHVDAGIIAAITSHLKSGSVRALAVDSQQRWKILPDVPTFTELGYKIKTPLWLGVVAPKGTPKEILQKLENIFEKAAKDPSFQEALERIDMIPIYRSGEEFRKLVFEDYDIQGERIKKLPLD